MLDIAIKGSCVSREGFNYQKSLFNEEMFKVSNYIFQKPLAVIESEKFTNINQTLVDKLKVELINQESVQDFVINQVTNSFTKKFLRDVNEDEKFFLMDFVDERMHLIKIGDSFIEYRREFINILQKDKTNYQIVLNSKEVFFQYIDRFINSVKELYPEENIILHKAYAVNTTRVDNKLFPLTSTFANPLDNRSINSYSIKRSTSVNLFFLEIYEYIEKSYPNIKIIELPIKAYYSPTNHKYGRGFYHYNDQYYYDFLERLKEITINKNTIMHEKVAIENKRHIHNLEQMQIVISNIYETKNKAFLGKNPEELLFRHLNSPIHYDLKNAGKPLLKSYLLNDSTPGMMVYDNFGELKAKLILNNNNEVVRVYTFYKNRNMESVTYITDEGEVKTTLYDNSKKKVTEEGKIETINKEFNKVYSVFNQNNQLILRMIDNTKLKQKRIIFYENNKINIALFFSTEKISKIIRYDHSGRIFEEFSMGEYIHIGKIHVKIRYNNNKKKIRYTFHATGNLLSRTFYTENERFLKTEIFDENGSIRKEIHFNTQGKKVQVIDYLAEGKKKIFDYSNSGKRKSVSFYQGEELIKKSVRNNDTELFRDKNLSMVEV